jgi:adenine-specific DNA-methyltransferase
VASYFAQTRAITAVDIQEYSRVICDALLCAPATFSVRSLENDLASWIADAAKAGVVSAARPLIDLEARAMDLAARGECGLLASLVEAGSMLTAQLDTAPREITLAMDEVNRRLSALPAAKGVRSMALRHFGGPYFSFRQAAEIDVLLDYAHSADPSMRSILIAAVLSTASELVNTVGKHFAQPIRPRDKHGKIKSTLHSLVDRDRNKPVLKTFLSMLDKYISVGSSRSGNRVVRADYSDFLRSPQFDAGVVYADPPYTRDHYSRFYHVLETLALRDDPKVSTNTAHGRTLPSRGVYRAERHQSPFCIRSEAPAAFDDLFQLVASRGVPLVLSYSPYASEKNAHPRVMTMDGVTEVAKRYFSKVAVESVGTFSHSRLNRSDLNKEISYEAEYLLLCEV